MQYSTTVFVQSNAITCMLYNITVLYTRPQNCFDTTQCTYLWYCPSSIVQICIQDDLIAGRSNCEWRTFLGSL